jgi:DNA-binding response OmpR family regulator
MREIGADDYVTKPLDLTRFLTVIDGLLDAKEATAS